MTGSFGFIDCVWDSLSSFLSKIMYLVLASLRSFSSMVCCMYGHALFHVFARDKCWWYICKFSRRFLQCKYLISSLILIVGILCVFVCRGGVGDFYSGIGGGKVLL